MYYREGLYIKFKYDKIQEEIFYFYFYKIGEVICYVLPNICSELLKKKKDCTKHGMCGTRVFVTRAYFCRIFKHIFDEEKCIFIYEILSILFTYHILLTKQLPPLFLVPFPVPSVSLQ